MSKVKMRCITCGKWFQSANAKEVTCPDCTQKARKDKLAQKNAPPAPARPGGSAAQYNVPRRPPAPPRPKPVQGGSSHWLDSQNDVKISQSDPYNTRPRPPSPAAPRGGPSPYRENRGPGGYRDGRSPGGPSTYREGGHRGPGGYRPPDGNSYSSPFGQRYRPQESFPGRGPRPDRPRFGGPRDATVGHKPKPKSARPPSPPSPKREKTPPPQPFVPTSEQIVLVENRYIELAAPGEFDGIRTQIAKEVGIPKKAVKKIVKDLRTRRDIPSWWELQTYKGSKEELDRIRSAYEPLLPLPEVGIHKQIATQLDLKPGVVYQAIKAIRLEMNLPQYNDPELHGSDFVVQDHQHATSEPQPPESSEPPVSSTEVETPAVEHTATQE